MCFGVGLNGGQSLSTIPGNGKGCLNDYVMGENVCWSIHIY